MASIPRTISDLLQTMKQYFRIGGPSGFRLSNSSGDCNVENAGGTSKAPLGAHTVKVFGSNADHRVGLTAPAGMSADVDFVLPAADGSPNQLIGTDGDGNLGFYDAASTAELCQAESFTQATSSPLTIFTPPANSLITKVQVQVEGAAAAGAPTISVGVSGTVERDMEAADVDLKTVGIYEVTPMTSVGGTPAAIIATITPDSQTFSGTVRVWYVLPL